jgi:polyisoprenyl-teichoic acid--peptidoglycan teichoic acid transferase
MGMKVYKGGASPGRGREPRDGRRGGLLRVVALAILVLFVVLLIFLISPLGAQRAVLLGSDARGTEAARADTIVVAKAGGGLLAVPRDTLVEIPGVGEDKINAAFAVGGPELTVETLENLTGLSIGDYVVVYFDGVEDIVNALGGITIDVREPIAYSLDGRYVEIPAGKQELDGFEALAYVRYRGDPSADIGRIGRQQQFLNALARETTSPAKLTRLPATARAVWNNIDTSMNPVEAAVFAARMRLSGGAEAEIYPGAPRYIDGISYWVPYKESGDQVVARTIE